MSIVVDHRYIILLSIYISILLTLQFNSPFSPFTLYLLSRLASHQEHMPPANEPTLWRVNNVRVLDLKRLLGRWIPLWQVTRQTCARSILDPASYRILPGGGSSSVCCDLAWELEGGRFKSSKRTKYGVSTGTLVKRCQFASWALPRCP